MKTICVSLVLGIMILTGCSQTQAVNVKSSKKETNYVPVKLEEVPSTVKQDDNAALKEEAQEDIEKYQREQAQMSDLEKMLQARERRR